MEELLEKRAKVERVQGLQKTFREPTPPEYFDLAETALGMPTTKSQVKKNVKVAELTVEDPLKSISETLTKINECLKASRKALQVLKSKRNRNYPANLKRRD